MSEPKLQLHATAPTWLGERITIVLVAPTHPGNVGACARAMRVMGLRRLVLVAPVDRAIHEQAEALARSSGATSILAGARVVDSLTDALASTTLAVAISAGQREFGPPVLAPDEAAGLCRTEVLADPAHEVALVFGTERTGLSISEVAHCQRLCAIPGERDYNSLNLAQAVQILCYELRRAACRPDPASATPRDLGDQPAPHADALSAQAAADPGGAHASARQIEGFFAHLERALVAIGFLDPDHPKKLMPRLRRLFARTRLETEEVQLLRGILKLVEAPRPPGQTGAEEPGSAKRS